MTLAEKIIFHVQNCDSCQRPTRGEKNRDGDYVHHRWFVARFYREALAEEA